MRSLLTFLLSIFCHAAYAGVTVFDAPAERRDLFYSVASGRSILVRALGTIPTQFQVWIATRNVLRPVGVISGAWLDKAQSRAELDLETGWRLTWTLGAVLIVQEPSLLTLLTTQASLEMANETPAPGFRAWRPVRPTAITARERADRLAELIRHRTSRVGERFSFVDTDRAGQAFELLEPQPAVMSLERLLECREFLDGRSVRQPSANLKGEA